MPAIKRRALILISSARQLPLVEPAEVTSISTGFSWSSGPGAQGVRGRLRVHLRHP